MLLDARVSPPPPSGSAPATGLARVRTRPARWHASRRRSRAAPAATSASVLLAPPPQPRADVRRHAPCHSPPDPTRAPPPPPPPPPPLIDSHSTMFRAAVTTFKRAATPGSQPVRQIGSGIVGESQFHSIRITSHHVRRITYLPSVTVDRSKVVTVARATRPGSGSGSGACCRTRRLGVPRYAALARCLAPRHHPFFHHATRRTHRS